MANMLCTPYLLGFSHSLNLKILNETNPKLVNKLNETIYEKDLISQMNTYFLRVVDHLFIMNCVDSNVYGKMNEMISKFKVGFCNFK